MDGDLAYCNNIQGIMEELHIEYELKQWRIFIDLSKINLKTVLLYDRNVKLSIPVALQVI